MIEIYALDFSRQNVISYFYIMILDEENEMRVELKYFIFYMGHGRSF